MADDHKKSGSRRIRRISVESNFEKSSSNLENEIHKAGQKTERLPDLSGLLFRTDQIEDDEDELNTDEMIDEADIPDLSSEDFLEEDTGPLPVVKKKPSKGPWIIIGMIIGAIFVLAIIVILYFSFMEKKSDTYPDMILEGTKYTKEADYTRAIELYEKAIKDYPKKSEGYYCLAEVYIVMGDPQKAQSILREGYKRTESELLLIRLKELENESITKDTIEETTPQTAEPSISGEASNVVVWALNPELAAENIMPLSMCTSGDDIYDNDVMVIIKDGKAGLINEKGQTVLNPEYAFIFECQGQIYAGFADGTAQQLSAEYVFVEGAMHTHDGKDIPGQSQSIPDHTQREGMQPVEENGLWGYANASGDRVIPCEYEGATYLDYHTTSNSITVVDGGPYKYADGYVPLKKDGVWGYFDKEGKLATPMVFDEARPVHNKLAWVKYEGKWGLISLGNAS